MNPVTRQAPRRKLTTPRSFSRVAQGNLDGDEQAGGRVACDDSSLVEVDGPPRDGQAESDAATGAAAVALDAEERLEDRPQQIVRHAGPMISHQNRSPIALFFQPDLDLCSLRCVSNGVAHHVFDRAAKEFWFSADAQGLLMAEG